MDAELHDDKINILSENEIVRSVLDFLNSNIGSHRLLEILTVRDDLKNNISLFETLFRKANREQSKKILEDIIEANGLEKALSYSHYDNFGSVAISDQQKSFIAELFSIPRVVSLMKGRANESMGFESYFHFSEELERAIKETTQRRNVEDSRK
ncbi:MAG: hypothetical protein WCP18_02375 [bacterium]